MCIRRCLLSLCIDQSTCAYVLTNIGAYRVDAGKVELDGAQYLGFRIPLTISQLVWIEAILVGGAEIYRNRERDPETRLYPGKSLCSNACFCLQRPHCTSRQCAACWCDPTWLLLLASVCMKSIYTRACMLSSI